MLHGFRFKVLGGNQMQIFKAEIIKEENGRLVFLELPFAAKDVFSIQKGTIYVKGTMNDIEYRNKLLSRGNGKYILVLNKELQKRVGFVGERMTVSVTMDVEREGAKNDTLGEVETAASDIDVVTAIRNRQSIRKFTSRQIEDKVLNTILNAGLQAPTAKNKRPYHFIVIKDRDVLGKLASRNSNAGMLKDAPCGILICGDSNIEGIREFLYADCAAAAQNMLLCCHGLGLGAVWCGVVRNSDWQKLLVEEFHIPVKIEPVAVIPIGYPDECREIANRWDNSKIHIDTW